MWCLIGLDVVVIRSNFKKVVSHKYYQFIMIVCKIFIVPNIIKLDMILFLF